MSEKAVDLFMQGEPTPGHDYLGYCGKDADGTVILCWKSAPESVREVKVREVTKQVVKEQPIIQKEALVSKPWMWWVVCILAVVTIIQVVRRVRNRKKY